MKILVVGCSITRGHGLEKEQDDPKLWVNQFIQKYFNGATIVSLAKSGVNDEWIFNTTLTEIIHHNYDVVIVGWSELSRLNMNLGLEPYCTTSKFKKDHDINLNAYGTVSKEWQNKIGNELRKYYNDHWNILKIVNYVNTLIYIQEITKKSKIYFVNTMAAWSQGYFNRKAFSTPMELSLFEQDMFQIKTRDDEEIQYLYNMVHNHYDYCGGIHEKNWLNLYNHLLSVQIDNASDIDAHPGYKSQDIFLNILSLAMDRL